MENHGDFVLSKTYVSADAEPVRSMCCTQSTSETAKQNEASLMDVDSVSETVILGSQGGSVTQFKDDNMDTFQGGHSHAITAMLDLPQGQFVTGCKDTFIRVFQVGSKDPISVLKGHSNAVTSLSSVTLVKDDGSSDSVNLLVSGSWDGTAKVWTIGEGNGVCLVNIGDHENTVCVQGLPPPDFSSQKPSATATYRGWLATASAGVALGNKIVDMKLRIYELLLTNGGVASANLRHTVQDHKGPIRDLAVWENQLASVSNDGYLNIRDSHTGETLMQFAHPGTLEGSPPLILSVAALGHGQWVTCTEDGCVYVWNYNFPKKSIQSILHPACVWRVIATDGDIFTACDDGNLRRFTREVSRMASSEDLEAFEHAVTEATMLRQQAASGGPTQEEIAKLPDWNTDRYNMRGKSEGHVQLFRKDRIAIAAQWSMASATWIEVGEVTGSKQSKGQIDGVEYDFVFPIEVDVPGGGVQNLQIGYNVGDNPFVAAQQFIDNHALNQAYLGQIADYLRQRAGTQATPPTLGMDTSSPAAGTPQQPPTPPSYRYLPMKGYRLFETGTDKPLMAKVVAKIREFNSVVSPDLQLSSDQCGALLDNLSLVLCATNRYHSSELSQAEMAVILKIIQTWPTPNIFPALDIARLMLLHPGATARSKTQYWTSLLDALLSKSDVTDGVAVPMLSLRVFCNAFKGFGSKEALASRLPGVITLAQQCVGSSNKNVRLSVATLALNASSYMLSARSNETEALFNLIAAILTTHAASYDSDAFTRALTALGTLFLSDTTENKSSPRS